MLVRAWHLLCVHCCLDSDGTFRRLRWLGRTAGLAMPANRWFFTGRYTNIVTKPRLNAARSRPSVAESEQKSPARDTAVPTPSCCVLDFFFLVQAWLSCTWGSCGQCMCVGPRSSGFCTRNVQFLYLLLLHAFSKHFQENSQVANAFPRHSTRNQWERPPHTMAESPPTQFAERNAPFVLASMASSSS